ncbi:MAG: mucoidy inhibitor MuiA family protein [Candidatus Hodarchaeota archaeon]
MQTRINQVTVFRDGARVTRQGTVALSAGPQSILVSGITELAQEDSFRVKGKGPASLSKIDVSRRREVFEPTEDAKPLHDRLKKLQNEYKKINDEIQLHEQHLVNLESMMNEFAGTYGMLVAASEAEITQLKEMDDKSTKMTEQTMKELRELRYKQQEIQDEIRVVNDSIGRIASHRKVETFYDVLVTVDMKEQAEIQLDISYQVSGAQWQPSYDIDLLSQIAKVRRVAMVNNRSREDWEKVNLVVSTATARPVQSIEGSPFIITAYDPSIIRAKKRDRAIPRAAMKAEKEYAKPSAVAPAEAIPPPAPVTIEEEFAEASEGVSGISVYELPKPVTIIEEEFESRAIHYWYTDGMAEVVAQDEITNGDTVLLPGGAKVYADGDYIGESWIDFMSPREKFKLGTRVAYDVKASKKLVEREVEKAGLTRSKLRREYKYRLEIESFSKKPIEIEVFDRIPHSNSTQIVVKLDSEKLGLEKLELGVMEWLLKIEPKQKKVLEDSYSVEWERNIIVNPSLP